MAGEDLSADTRNNPTGGVKPFRGASGPHRVHDTGAKGAKSTLTVLWHRGTPNVGARPSATKPERGS